jgi:Fn3 associated
MDALDTLKETLVYKDQWRENGSYVEKPPFPKPQTDVRDQELTRKDDTGAVILRLTPVYGDTVYYEVGAQAPSASAKVQDPKHFETNELEVSFLCVDTKGEHETGAPVTWRNRFTIKSRTFQSGHDKMVELRVAPAAPLRYTSDGSDPKIAGASYHDPFVVPQGTHVVLAVAEKNGLVSDVHRLDIDWQGHDAFTIDPDQPVTWKREHTLSTTKESYEFLDRLKKYQAVVSGLRVSIVGQPHWLELTCDNGLRLEAANLEAVIEHLRGLLSEGQVTVEAPIVTFPTGQHLLDWVAEVHTTIHPHEVSQ